MYVSVLGSKDILIAVFHSFYIESIFFQSPSHILQIQLLLIENIDVTDMQVPKSR